MRFRCMEDSPELIYPDPTGTGQLIIPIFRKI